MEVINLYFAIIGDDARMDYAAERLYSLGFDVSRDLNRLSDNTNLIIPPPVGIKYYDILKPYLKNIKAIYGGAISSDFKNMIGSDIYIYDYLSWDSVIAENAKLTALGIIKEAISIKANLYNSKILVTGYGFCGKAIGQHLKDYTEDITIAVRNSRLLKEINNDGFKYADINNLVSHNLSSYNYVFNTVPAMIITKQVIDCFDNSVMIFDIASKPGGVDFNYCKDKNIYAVLSLGIPGRDFPKEAGYLIGDACFNHYKSMQ